MKIAIINLTGGGMSGGYRKYLQNVLPRMAESNDVEEILLLVLMGIEAVFGVVAILLYV